jgi:xanthine phosphoribosyltransferase
MSWFKKKETAVKEPGKLVLSFDDIKYHTADIIRRMQFDNWKPDYVVGLTRGGLLPAVLISQYLDVPMYTLKVSLRDGDEADCDHNCWMAEDALGRDAEKFNILIVDDINDTGATLAWIRDNWKSVALPDDPGWDTVWHNNVRIATLVNNLSSKEDVDYWSLEVNKAEEDVWIEFPTEEWWKK